ncbi:hypothetical protein TNCV_2583901 [Trichonephila clavipes]|nr:hypothetical protein TNCV_2583901 [Trichonephila clavipes]
MWLGVLLYIKNTAAFPKEELHGRLKAWANWDRARASASIGASSCFRLSFNKMMIQIILMNECYFDISSDIFCEKLGISNYRPIGLSCDDQRPCLDLSLPPLLILHQSVEPICA